MKIATRIENAKGEILSALQKIQEQHGLPPCIMEGVLSSVTAEVRSGTKIELINEMNETLQGLNEELEKAKKEAKKVLGEEFKQEHAV